MATYAVLNNSNVVENIISAETLEVAEAVTHCVCVEYTSSNLAQIGWIYDEATNTFVPPTTESSTDTVE
jgi:hypothetical protein